MMYMILQDKIDVNGKNADPIYKLLKDEQPKDLPNGLMIPGEKGRVTWNYTSNPSPISSLSFFFLSLFFDSVQTMRTF